MWWLLDSDSESRLNLDWFRQWNINICLSILLWSAVARNQSTVSWNKFCEANRPLEPFFFFVSSHYPYFSFFTFTHDWLGMIRKHKCSTVILYHYSTFGMAESQKHTLDTFFQFWNPSLAPKCIWGSTLLYFTICLYGGSTAVRPQAGSWSTSWRLLL